MVELVSAIAKSLVEHPENVEVSESQSNGTTVIQLKVAPEDMALCEFVCTSKTPVQEILDKGIELMIKELS